MIDTQLFPVKAMNSALAQLRTAKAPSSRETVRKAMWRGFGFTCTTAMVWCFRLVNLKCSRAGMKQIRCLTGRSREIAGLFRYRALVIPGWRIAHTR